MSLVNLTAAQLKHKIISLLDLTQLDDTATEQDIINLCQTAVTSLGNVAAVCIAPAFVALAKKQLNATPILIATVANFPTGKQPLLAVEQTVQKAIMDGADEIDIVIPYHFYLQKQAFAAKEFMQHFRHICADKITLKFILETGALHEPALIEQAGKDAIAAGADFIKTSTGKTAIGATLPAAEILLNAIKKMHVQTTVGFKASGGIRTIKQAVDYLLLAEKIMGEHWLTAQHLRFGASSLLNEFNLTYGF